MKHLLAAFFTVIASPVFAECAARYVQVTVPLCQLNTTPVPVITSPESASCTYAAGLGKADWIASAVKHGSIWRARD